MGAVYFTREIIEAIVGIAYELKRMNDLKEKELYLKYGEYAETSLKYIKILDEIEGNIS